MIQLLINITNNNASYKTIFPCEVFFHFKIILLNFIKSNINSCI
nr:MAG TPA: hypothetical protein [Caudoviricetes sp.]